VYHVDIVPRKEHFSLRIEPATKEALALQARQRGATVSSLAERYLEEAVRMERHRGILFVDGPAGRRPRLVTGPDVWEVIETFLSSGRSTRATAEYLHVPEHLVETAVDYYADHREEIDDWIASNQALAHDLEASWRRRAAIVGG
jgi:hypothetical protein